MNNHSVNTYLKSWLAWALEQIVKSVGRRVCLRLSISSNQLAVSSEKSLAEQPVAFSSLDLWVKDPRVLGAKAYTKGIKKERKLKRPAGSYPPWVAGVSSLASLLKPHTCCLHILTLSCCLFACFSTNSLQLPLHIGNGSQVLSIGLLTALRNSSNTTKCCTPQSR